MGCSRIFKGLLLTDYPKTSRSRLKALFSLLAATAVCGGIPIAAAQDDTWNRAADVEVLGVFGLESGVVFPVQFGQVTAAGASGPVILQVPIEGTMYTLDLKPFSVRADDYKVIAHQADGSFLEVAPGPIRTLRGTVVELDGSQVAASLNEKGLYAKILLPNGDRYGIEPVAPRLAGSPASDHVIYADDSIIPSGGTCGTTHQAPAEPIGAISGSGTVAGGLAIAELAIDVDSDYFLSLFQSHPDRVAAMEEHVNNIINAVNLQYEAEVSIRHVITSIVIRTSQETDPYYFDYTTNANSLLRQFQLQWSFGSERFIPRDVAQLFTGRDLDGNVLGIAYLGTVCFSGSHYSVTAMSFGNFGCKTDLSAHELGHSWNATHCGGSNCSPPCQSTMNCNLTCANTFVNNIIDSIGEIGLYRDRAGCLDPGDVLRRISILSATNIVEEGSSIQLTALADFRFGEDLDVTDESLWWVEPPEAGSIDENGVFTAGQVDGNTCVTVFVSYNDGFEDFVNSKIILVEDADLIFGITDSVPPNNAIDARQPTRPDGSLSDGWSSVDVVFNGDTCLISRVDFTVTFGSNTPAPLVTAIESLDARTLRLTLQRDMAPGEWTEIAFGSQTLRLGYLPGDVDGNAISNADDVITLLDSLNNPVGSPPIWSVDLDRSGATGPNDVLRLIDLLNGADALAIWNEVVLP